MSKISYHISQSKRQPKQIYDSIPNPCVFRGVDYGLGQHLTGKGVKIAIIDSGTPDHKDIKNVVESVDMSETERDKIDHNGHSTMIAGVLSANNPKSITGISTESDLYFIKVIDSNGDSSFNSLVAGVLWAVVKQVDIIVISLGSPTNYSVLHDTIKKAYEQNICVFAAAGEKTSVIEYPSSYPEVLSVARLKETKSNKFVSGSTGLQIAIPMGSVFTTYLHNKYTKANGSSLTTAMIAGLASLLIQKNKEKNGKKPTPNQIYSELTSLSYKPK